MHLGLLAGADETDGLSVLLGENIGSGGSHGGNAHIGAERAVHHADREALFDLREDDNSREILHTKAAGVRGEDRDPLHAADLLIQQRCRQAVDALLGLLVEDLHDLIGK